MQSHQAISFLLLTSLAFVTGCAWHQSVNRRLDRLETIARYNHDRIETVTARVPASQKPARPLTKEASTKPPRSRPSLCFRSISGKKSEIALAKADLSLFFASGAYELTPSHKDELKRLLARANGAEDLSVTVNAFSSQGSDPVLDYNVSTSRGLSVYKFLIMIPDLPRIRAVTINACGVHFATGKRRYDRRVDIILNGSSLQERES